MDSDYEDTMELSDDSDEETEEEECELPKAKDAAISRPRSFERSSKPKKNRTRVRGGASTTVSRVNSAKRIEEFPGEHLCISAGQLFCDACHTVVMPKKSIVKGHISTDRHRRAKDQRKKAAAHQATLTTSWKKYQEKHEEKLKGTGLSTAMDDSTIMRRTNVVEAMLKAGIALAKVDYLRPLLEANNAKLTFSTHLAQIIPFLLETEKAKLKEEVKTAQHIAVIFDGTTYLGEAFAILVRFLDDDWRVQQRLVRLHVLAKSMTGLELARELATCLSTTFQLADGKLVAFVRDGAAVNGVAVDQVKNLFFPRAMDVLCASHALDNVGRRFATPVLAEFATWWVSLFAKSPAARLAWKTRTGVSPKSHSNTRWWSLYEVLAQVLRYFGDVEPFLTNCEWSPAARRHCLAILHNETAENSADLFQVELAVTIDAGEPFVKKTYILEGDGPLSTNAYQHLQEVATAAQDAYYPNVAAVVKKIAHDNRQLQKELTAHATACVQPAICYFLRKFNHVESPLHAVVAMYKAARLACPKYVARTNPAPAEVDTLRVLPVLDDDQLINDLKLELAPYKVAAAEADIANDDDLAWWREHAELSQWSKAAKVLLTVPPSSASAERVFSLLQAAMTSQQERTLEDHIELQLMLQYNRGRMSLEL